MSASFNNNKEEPKQQPRKKGRGWWESIRLCFFLLALNNQKSTIDGDDKHRAAPAFFLLLSHLPSFPLVHKLLEGSGRSGEMRGGWGPKEMTLVVLSSATEARTSPLYFFLLNLLNCIPKDFLLCSANHLP